MKTGQLIVLSRHDRSPSFATGIRSRIGVTPHAPTTPFGPVDQLGAGDDPFL